MQGLQVPVTLGKARTTKGNGIAKDGDFPKGVADTINVVVCIPDDDEINDLEAWQKCLDAPKLKWNINDNKQATLEYAPSIGKVMEMGFRALARARGQSIINENVKRAIASNGGPVSTKGKKSNITKVKI